MLVSVPSSALWFKEACAKSEADFPFIHLLKSSKSARVDFFGTFCDKCYDMQTCSAVFKVF